MDPIPLNPPKAWFEPPAQMPRGQKITVITEGPEAGRCFGYVAPFDSCLLTAASLGQQTDECFPAPHSPTKYELAMQGDTLTAEGELIHTANIGGGVNHYEEGGYLKTVDHYANTASQLMRVRYGEDQYGIWAAGAMWPDVTDHQVAKVRASALSGDWRWRPELQNYDMAGSQLVSNPAYPHLRFLAASAGQPPPLVGGWGGVVMDDDDDDDDLLGEEYDDDLQPIVAAVDLSTRGRKRMASSGVAMSDGTFPIPNVDFLRRAVRRLGSTNKDKAKVKAHIIKRARALGATSQLPEGWTSRKAASAMAHECTCGASDPDPVAAALTPTARQELLDELKTELHDALDPFLERLEEAVTRSLVEHV